MDVMSPAHPRWDEFYERLEGPEGCDFHVDVKGKITWECSGYMERSKSVAILETLEGVDVESSLKFFEEHGGYCDCEVLFNVRNRLEEDVEASQDSSRRGSRAAEQA